MDKLFLDTNVLVEVGARRSPHYLDSVEVVGRISSGNTEGALSALSLSNMAYVMKKLTGKSQVGFFRNLTKILVVAPMGQSEVDAALKRGQPDFEDGLQWEVARAGGATHLLTRNVKDFPVTRALTVLSPADYLARLINP